MKKLILALLLMTFAYGHAQVTAFQENFENLPLKMTSSGSATWSRSTKLKASGLYSDSTRLVNIGDTAKLTTDTFNTLGFTKVFLRFDHICKLAYGDGGYVEYSTNNGLSWTPIPIYCYKGTGQYAIYTYFNSVSYPAEWLPLDHTVIPTNSWWKHEEFDISSLVANNPQIKIRFRAQDLNINGGEGDYGWLVDNVTVIKSMSELTPPTIILIDPVLPDTVNYTGPYDVRAYITDSSGVQQPMLIYNHGNATDTLMMVKGISNDYLATIPSFAYDSSFCYRVVAIDSSLSHNVASLPGVGCKTIYVKKAMSEKIIGLGAATNNISPVYIDNGAVNLYSNHISIFTSNELGFNGKIKKLAYFKSNTNGFSGANNIMRIYVKNTALATVPTAAGSFANELVGAVLVYENLNQTFPATSGWMEFICNQANFDYNGTGNLMVLVDFYHPTASAVVIPWSWTTGLNKAVTFYGSSANPSATAGLHNRPNFKFLYDTIQFNYDASISKIVSPTSPNFSTGSTNIKVRVMNKAKLAINKVVINWTVDGVIQTPFTYTGNIPADLNSNDIIIGSKIFNTGSHKVITWTSLPNDSVDQNMTNDSLSVEFYACSQPLSGNYTIGSAASADFHSIGEVSNVLRNCGVQGPTVFNILPGVYNERVSFDTILALDSIRTVTFQSSTLNPNDVLIQGEGAAGSDYIIRFNLSKYITFNAVSIKNNATSNTSCVSFINGAKNIVISNCRLNSLRATTDGSYYAVYSSGKNDNISLLNNDISGGQYCIYVTSTAGGKADNFQVVGNKIYNWRRYGSSFSYTSNLLFSKNTVLGGHIAPASFGIQGVALSYSTRVLVEKNNIMMNLQGPGYGIDLQSFEGESDFQNRIYNNFVSINGTSNNSNAEYCIHLNALVSYVNIYNNSLYIDIPGVINSVIYIEGLSATSMGNINIKNNVVANISGGNGLNVTTTSAPNLGAYSKFDNNCYYSNGGACVRWGATAISLYQGVSALTATYQMDSNSVLAAPSFYSPTNLHSFSSAINNKGAVFADLKTDYDDQARSLTTPDIGADEFSVSTVDVGIIGIVQPLPMDTQNRVVAFKALVQNFGSAPITSITAKYAVNNGSPVSGNWTGNLASGAIDTINFGNFTVPALNYTIKAYTTLAADTLRYNDTTNAQLYGLPIVNLTPIAILSPVTGCDKTSQETVKVRIKNLGASIVSNGASVSYKVNSTAMITENITTPIAAGDSIDFSFSTKLNMFAGYNDSSFAFTIVTNHIADPLVSDDTLKKSVIAMGKIYGPTVTDTTINYGQTANLIATSINPIKWYSSPASTVVLASGSNYVTPALFDTTVYYAQATLSNPPQNIIVGTGTLTTGPYDYTGVYGGGDFGTCRHQYLYLASELQALGMSANNITSIGFFLAAAGGGAVNNWELKIGSTTASALTSTYVGGTVSKVLGTVNILPGWNQHILSSPFYWDGTSNIVVEICTPGGLGGNPSIAYSTTAFGSSISNAGASACLQASGIASTNRANIRFMTSGTNGCTSDRVPVQVNVILPAIEARMDAIINPISDCNLSTSSVTARIINMGTSTIPAGFTAAYKINNGAYTAPATISSSIAPTDTLNFTFPVTANLPSGLNGTKYKIKAYLSVPSDTYYLNDTISSDSIESKYTPAAPIVFDTTVSYGQIAKLRGISNDSILWYSDANTQNYLGVGSNFNAGNVYDTTFFYGKAQRMKPLANYTLGVSKGANTTYSPSPYGATGFGSKNQYLIKASELKAMGIQKGEIRSIAFQVQTVKGTPLENYTISLGQTLQDSLLNFLPAPQIVYQQTVFSEVSQWNVHNFIQPYIWDGKSNLVVQTCFKNSTSAGGFTQMNYDSAFFIASANYQANSTFDCGETTPLSISYYRPLMRFSAIAYGDCASSPSPLKVTVTNFPNSDASVTKMISPNSNLLVNGVSDVKVVIKNYGLNTMTSATIKWSENGDIQNTYNWTGNLLRGKTDTILLASNYVFHGGPTKVAAFITLAADTFKANDTASVDIKVCMHDTIKVGPTRILKTFNQAVDALSSCGVCGPVVFAVDSGSYSEQFLIGNIAGISAINTVTFISAALDSTKVKVYYGATSTTNNYVVKLLNANYIKFKYLSLNATGAFYSTVVNLQGTTNNVSFENMEISSALYANQNQAEAHNFWGTGTGLNNITIKNNRIKNGQYSIYFNATSAVHQRKITIENNIFTNFSSVGIYFYYVDSSSISKNVLVGTNTEAYYYGIRLMQCGVTDMYNNKITLFGNIQNYGIYYWTVNASAARPSMVYNNMISLTNGSGSNLGILMETTQNATVAYNSVYVVSGDGVSAALKTTNGSGLKVLNNNLMNLYGYTISTNNPAAISDCNYNNYFTDVTNVTNFANWSSPKANFAALLAADPTKNTSSINANPYFYSTNDLHVNSAILNAKATPIPGITSDFDGDIRNSTTPDIGADEFNPLPKDVGVTALLNPKYGGCDLTSTDSVKVRILNFGIDTIFFNQSNVQAVVTVTGTNPIVLTKTINNGFLASAQTMDVMVAPVFSLSTIGKYTFVAKTVWALDGKASNDALMPISIVHNPKIDTFPFFDDFESGNNITFKEFKGGETSISIDNAAASAGTKGIHLQGGVFTGWGSHSTVEQAFQNTSHVAILETCEINATNTPYLSLRFDLKQTKTSNTGGSSSWFRVKIYPAVGNSAYLVDANGDSAFTPITTLSDPFVNHIFNLNAYAGTKFTLSLEAANCYGSGIAGTAGDNVYIDNFSLFTPTTYDISAKSFANLSNEFAKTGNIKYIQFTVENIGTDTLDSIPIAYRVDNGPIRRDTIYTSVAPNATSTKQFSVPFVVASGLQTIYAFTEFYGDANQTNDTIQSQFKGLNVYTIDYFDNFDGATNDWVHNGFYDQWELGTPAKNQISTASSAPNAWITRLQGPYVSNAVENLYSPFITIPLSTDTVTLEFQQNMDVVANKAYGRIQYSFDEGDNWLNIGYINDSLATNWYNTNINGLHVWSSSTNGWIHSSIKLDPAVFNTGNQVWFRFVFKSEANLVVADGWAIDDFKLSIKIAATDAGVTAIQLPNANPTVGDSAIVKVRIENFGADTLVNVPVNYFINGSLAATEIWFGKLAPATDTSFTFNQKFFVNPNSIKLCAITNKPGDAIHSNDTACANFTSTPASYDAGITRIIAPIGSASTLNQNTVKVKIKNFGTTTLTSIPVSYRRNNIIISTETFTGSIAPGDSADYTFTNTFMSLVGAFNLCAKTILPNDAYNGNNEICSLIVGSGIEDNDQDGFSLSQNIPNPTSGKTQFKFTLPNAGDAKLSVINLLGETVYSRKLEGNAGVNTVELDFSSFNSGVYYYIVEFNGMKRVKRMIIGN